MRLRIVPLDPSLHDRGAFSCGNHRVDAYLRVTAAQAAKHFRAATFVLLQTDDANHRILGFYTLAPHEYHDDDEFDNVMARALRVQSLQRIPMILLGQLGIAVDFQGKGLGGMLLKHALNRALNVANEVGGVAVITDPYDDRARDFYAKYGFQLLHEQPFVRMLLSMRTLARSIVEAKAKALISQGDKTKR